MTETPRFSVVINGQPRELTAAATVGSLLSELGFAGKRVAVERNGLVVPKSEHDSTQLQADDRLEIVHFVGGG